MSNHQTHRRTIQRLTLIAVGSTLALALLLAAGQASAIVPENCIGIRCQYEQDIKRRENNMNKSRIAENNLFQLKFGNFGSGRARLPDPGLGSLTGDHPDSYVMGEDVKTLAHMVDSLRNPAPGQRNSRLVNERQVDEINQLKSYIRRCFAANDPTECQVVWVKETVTQGDITYTFDLFNCYYHPTTLWSGTITVHEIGDYHVNFVPNSGDVLKFGIEPQIVDDELPIEFGLEWEYLVTRGVGADFPYLDFAGGVTGTWGLSAFVETPFRFPVQLYNPPEIIRARCPSYDD